MKELATIVLAHLAIAGALLVVYRISQPIIDSDSILLRLLGMLLLLFGSFGGVAVVVALLGAILDHRNKRNEDT